MKSVKKKIWKWWKDQYQGYIKHFETVFLKPESGLSSFMSKELLSSFTVELLTFFFDDVTSCFETEFTSTILTFDLPILLATLEAVMFPKVGLTLRVFYSKVWLGIKYDYETLSPLLITSYVITYCLESGEISIFWVDLAIWESCLPS